MDKPHIVQKMPIVTEVQPGTYWWCQCGLSRNQPFCDGSHKVTEFVPKEVVIPGARKVAWCACKQTGNPPFCDGTHKKV